MSVLLASILSSPSMGLLSNRIEKADLKAGDHIYSWRTLWGYAHHGIYVGDDKVIHFTSASGQKVGLLASSSSTTPCLVCGSNQVTAAAATETNGGVVTSSCLSCFLKGGDLFLFEYAVSQAYFLANVVRGTGTCTVATADPDEVVVRRAKDLLTSGYGSYDLFTNNCENFAIYCKTGSVQPSSQVVAATAAAICVIL